MTKVMKLLYSIGLVLIGLGVASLGGGYTIGNIMRSMEGVV